VQVSEWVGGALEERWPALAKVSSGGGRVPLHGLLGEKEGDGMEA
jgi:hypothetical protein